MKGCLYRHKRAKGDVWVLRYRDNGTNRKEQFGRCRNDDQEGSES
jgi:hypothetical protein